MMSPYTRRNTIIILSIVLLLILLWLLSFLIPKSRTSTPASQTAPASQTESQTSFTSQQLEQEKAIRTQASAVTTTAKLFVERYGSYSNEANFQNIRDVIPLMSVKFAAATTADLVNKKAPAEYYGVTTRVITAKVVSQDDKSGTAVIDLATQRVEENGSAQNKTTKYQDIELLFVKESGVWMVDSAKWR